MTLTEQLSIELLESIGPVLAQLRVRRPQLADQLERAATSTALNIAEGHGRCGNDSRRVLRIAAGEAHEAKAALTVARALRYVDTATINASHALADRLCGVLHGLVRSLS